MELSIITINRDNCHGLDETIQSVRDQTFRDFEYIIIDGKSSDGSVDVIKEHLTDGLDLKWLSEEDAGIFDAMNKGIRMASGKYLLFLNSGDTLDNETVIRRVLERPHNADVLIGQCRVMKGGQQIWMQSPRKRYTLKSVLNDSIPHQASFIQRELFERYGLYRDDLRMMGDWEFFLRTIILGGCSVEPLPIVISQYDTTGVSSNQKNQKVILAEKDRVFSDLHLGSIVPDYRDDERWRSDHEALLWASGKKWINRMLNLIYKLARSVKRHKKAC